MIAGENHAKLERLLRFPLMQEFEKITEKTIFTTALGAPEDFEIFD